MKRFIMMGVGLGMAVALWGAVGCAEEKKAEGQPAAAQEIVAFTFTDEAQLQSFAQLWQGRQAVLMRMGALQAYWAEEQARLQQANEQLLSQYQLDVSKNYTLDVQRKVLIEQPGAPAAPAALDQPPAAPIPTN